MKEEIPIEFYKEYEQYCKKSAVEILNEDIRNNRDWECEIIQVYQRTEKSYRVLLAHWKPKGNTPFQKNPIEPK